MKDDLLCGGAFCWIARRRGLLTVTLACLALANVLWGRAEPVHLLGPGWWSPVSLLLWVFLVAGITVRIWGAGNLRKNKEVTRTGVYRMVRHPLYLGNCLLFLVFFASVGGVVGLVLFTLLLFGVHYPVMIQEEARLAREYPGQFADHRRLRRLVPDLSALPEALDSDCFSWSRVRANYGTRTLWALVLLPCLPEALEMLRDLV